MNEEFKYEEELDQHFRDRVATIDEKGKRFWIFAKKPKGKFTNYRTVVATFFLILLAGLPFVRVNGEPCKRLASNGTEYCSTHKGGTMTGFIPKS